MYDEGVFSSKELETRLAAKELAASLEGKVRKLFGIKDRSFTTKEMVFIGNWASVFNYDIAVIKHAYEITVNAINEPSIPYEMCIRDRGAYRSRLRQYSFRSNPCSPQVIL